MRKKQLFFLLALWGGAFVHAQNYDFSATAPSGQTLYYKIMTSNTVSVVYPNYANNDYWSGYTKPSLTLTVPSTVTNGGTTYSVTAIAPYAFYGCSTLENVNMPTSLTSIGNYAFYNCSYIYHIVVPEGVVNIGDYAFYGLSLAYDISLPSTLETIGAYAFYGVSNIHELTIPRNVHHIGASAFATSNQITTLNYNADSCFFNGYPQSWGSSSSLIFNSFGALTLINFGSHVRYISSYAFYGSCITSLSFPNSLRTIDHNAFENCPNLASVDFGNGVETIGYNAFSGCYHITSLTLPNTVKTIESEAFSNCNISSLTIPNSLEYIGGRAFQSCANLTNVNFNADSCVGYYDNGNSYIFLNCPHLTTFTFGNNVKSIPDGLCAGTHIITVQIPNSVKNIGEYSFAECDDLQTVNFGNSIDSIGDGAFYSCSSLNSITLPNEIRYIGESSFFLCTAITSVTIPHNVTYIGDDAFYGTGLTDVYFNADSCLYMGQYHHTSYGSDYITRALRNCGNLANIHIGNNVKYIPPYAFCSINALTSVTIPNSVRKIGEGAFRSCTNLSSVTLGNSVDSIMASAFYGCASLSSVNLPNSLKVIQEDAFASCSTLVSITIPQNVIKFGKFTGCTSMTEFNFNADSCIEGEIGALPSLSSVNIGNNVKNIPYGFCRECTSLHSIIVPSSVKKIGGYAFYRCASLDSVFLSDSLEEIETYAFYRCSSLTSIIIPKSIKHIEEAFVYCMNLHSVYYNADSCTFMGNTYARSPFNNSAIQEIHIGANVKYLPFASFYGCSNVERIYCAPSTPPAGYGAFFDWSRFGIPVYVPCTAIDDYQSTSGWNQFTNYQLMSGDYSIHISSADENMGGTEYITTDCESGTATIEAIPAEHFRFVSWNDGNTNNPRYVTLTNDTSLMANFEPDTFIVNVFSNVDSLGSVTGGGVYYHGDTARVYAHANGGAYFDHWGNASVSNPYVFVVDDNSSVVAYFSPVSVDTIVFYDTVSVNVPYPVHDTTVINTYIHDTTIVNNYIHDTTYVNVPYLVHDTTIVMLTDTIVNTVFDTVVNTVYDTTIIDNYIYDTTIVDNYIYDTTIIDNYIYDTTIVDNYIYDTTIIDNYIYDTTIVDNYVYDTTIIVDTVWLTITDTIYIHDTIYVDNQDINGVETTMAKIYQRDGQLVIEGAEGLPVRVFDAVGREVESWTATARRTRTSALPGGVYLVRIGDAPARRIVVVR